MLDVSSSSLPNNLTVPSGAMRQLNGAAHAVIREGFTHNYVPTFLNVRNARCKLDVETTLGRSIFLADTKIQDGPDAVRRTWLFPRSAHKTSSFIVLALTI